jgi:hypothetical protein
MVLPYETPTRWFGGSTPSRRAELDEQASAAYQRAPAAYRYATRPALGVAGAGLPSAVANYFSKTWHKTIPSRQVVVV